jgi:hypothetical protein
MLAKKETGWLLDSREKSMQSIRPSALPILHKMEKYEEDSAFVFKF